MVQGLVGLQPDGLAVVGDRLVVLALVRQGDAEVVVVPGLVGLQPDGLAEGGDRLVDSPLSRRARPRLSWCRASSGFSRMASRYSAIASSCSPLSLQGVAEVVVGQGVVGLEPDGLAVVGDRLVVLALALQGDAEVVVGLGEVGLQPDGLAVGGDRLVVLALALQGVAEVVVGTGRRRASAGWPRGRPRSPRRAHPCPPRRGRGCSGTWPRRA